MTRASALACLMLPLLLAPAAADKLSAADRTWIGSCSDQLMAEKASETMRRRYCACMHDYVDDNAKVSQREMERLFPPAHRRCRTKAGWK
jgi:hypothetical protein